MSPTAAGPQTNLNTLLGAIIFNNLKTNYCFHFLRFNNDRVSVPPVLLASVPWGMSKSRRLNLTC